MAISKLGTIDSNIVDQLLAEFTSQQSSTGPLVGTFDTTERLLLAGFDSERVDSIMEEIRGPAGRTMWDKLGNVDENVLANYLKNEYPQTVALVLSKLKPEHCSRVLSVLPENFAMEVIMRLLQMEAVQKDVLDGVEKTLRSEFMSNLAARSGRPDSHELMANIFNNFDLPIYGKGKNSREWIYVEDHCEALYKIFKNGKIGETYNIGSNKNLSNLDVCRYLLIISKNKKIKGKRVKIKFVKDRPGHDFRYAIDSSKLKKKLNWKPKTDFKKGLIKTFDWYYKNKKYFSSFKKKDIINRLGKI